MLFLTVFIDLMGFGIVIPLLPLYADRMQATPFQIGLLMAVYSLMQLAFAPVWGRISDRVGRRPVLLVSLAGSAVSYLLLAAAGSLGMLFAARILAGVAGANISVAQAYIADVTPPDERAGAMGMIGAAFGLGMVIGPALGGGLSLVGPRVPELVAAGLCAVNVVAAWMRLPESLPPAQRSVRPFRHPLSPAELRDAMRPPGAAVAFAVFFLVTVAFAILEGTFSLAAKDRFGYASNQVGLLWFYMGVVAVVVQGWLVGRLARRLAEPTLVAAGTACLAAGLLWIDVASGRPGLLAALALVVTGQGLASPSLSSLISKSAGRQAHGRALGVSQSFSAGGRALGPAGGGFVFGRFGPGAPYLVAAACAAGALGLVLPGARTAPAATDAEPRLRKSG